MSSGGERQGRDGLRGRAERELAAREVAAPTEAEADLTRLLNEVRVQQIELEMQNEELRRAQLEIAQGLRRYTELFDFAPIGYFVLTHDGRINELNLAGARLLGQERGRLVGRLFGAYFPDDQHAPLKDFLAQVTRSEDNGGGSSYCDLTLVAPDGVAREVHLTAASLGGVVPTTLCAVEDISARKQAEAALREEIRHRDSFMATLSHELRNPLAPISNSLHMLNRVPPDGEQASRARQIMSRQVEHMAKLVDDLLDVTRISRNRIVLRKDHLDLNEVVRRTVEDNRSCFDDAGVQLQLEPAVPAVPVYADRTRLSQIVGNLLRNAAKFTPAGGHARAKVGTEGDEAVLRIVDDGVGIAPDTLARLFQPFVQARQSLDRSQGGLGLGLALVKGLVELHGGSIAAHSAGIGKGAELVVRLPQADARAHAAATTGGPSATAARRILIIDDNVDQVDSLREVLSLAGHEVETAYDGPDGIAKAQQFRPDAVVCDIGLPGMNGYEVAQTLRAEPSFARLFLLALTGYAQSDDRERAEAAGFDGHLAKPPDLTRLTTMLDRLHA